MWSAISWSLDQENMVNGRLVWLSLHHLRTLQHAEMAEHNVTILFSIVKISLWMDVWASSDEIYYYVYTKEV